jgi:osmotically inducible protein OsmC
MGDGREGLGFVSTESGALQSHPYTVDSRFSGSTGTSPEELIAAASASSFTMYLALILAEAGFTVAHLDTTALVTLQSDQHGFTISRVHLVLTASIPAVDDATFQSHVAKAKANCVVSKLLSAEISLNAKLAEEMAASR